MTLFSSSFSKYILLSLSVLKLNVFCCICLITITRTYTCRFVSTIRNALTHMNAHTNALVHMHNHTPCTCNTQHHVPTGWILSSLFCKPAGSWQDCGDAASGWGYSRPAEQGGKVLFVLLSLGCAMRIIHCTLSTTQHSGKWESHRTYPTHSHLLICSRESNHLCIGSMTVYLVHGLGTCFFQKFGLRVLVWDQNSCEYCSR